ncbi:COX15/CtaA family protein [Sphingomonas sp. Y38-1Y]|uniref:COX15/CtaA family protein n=1 Tax=Sphingomonas sp. Y38-1Y TaxID=3078265 RepID=UPI0028F128C3|nr:COX15/CtaA family protein [Sphingomonas sp. Y38-1Y]
MARSLAAAPSLSARVAQPRAIATWLYAVAVLIVLMVAVGGITRLTESGLSITEWKPVSGAIPPLNAADWQAEFAKYQATPEYRQINAGMSLADFQFIYFWEWLHRLLGRLIGVAFALPLAWFWVCGRIPTGYHGRLVALLALGAAQGAVGWWMVASGLVDRTDVSHYRLAAHLCLALFILGGLVWTARDLTGLARNPSARPARLTPLAFGALGVLAIQIMFGAYVAGLNAGLVTDEWPLMNGRVVPQANWADAFDDPFALHFIHRWWAFVAFAAMMLLARAAKRAGDRGASIAIHVAVGIQILLGIATVMTGVRFEPALTHQIVGALLVAAATAGAHATGRRA